MKKYIIRAIFTLTAFTFLDRLLGFFFKIYLSREMGGESMGIYQVALSAFFVLLTLTTSGVPLIVSKLTAKYRTENNRKAERGTVGAAIVIGLVTAGILCLGTLALSPFVKNLFASPISMTLLLIMLPAVLSSGVYAAFRGNLWGQEKYTAVSVIEVVEQVARIALCVVLFLCGFNKLKVTALSLSVACLISCVACAACYFIGKDRVASPKGHIKPLLKSSLPITMVRTSSSVVNSLVALCVPFLLQSQGLDTAQSMYIFGSSVGMALPLLYIPITVVGSLAYVMIPTLSKAVAENDKASVEKQVRSAITFSIVVSAMFVPAFFALGKPMGMFVYDNADSGSFLSFSAWLLIPLAVENITSSMMNSLDLERKGLINYLIGSGILFVIMFAFYGRFDVKVLSMGMGISWTVSCLLDFLSIKRKLGIKLNIVPALLKSVALIFPTVLMTQSLYRLLSFLPDFFAIAIPSLLSLVFMAALCFVFCVFDFSLLFSRKKDQNKNRRSKRLQKTNK